MQISRWKRSFVLPVTLTKNKKYFNIYYYIIKKQKLLFYIDLYEYSYYLTD